MTRTKSRTSCPRGRICMNWACPRSVNRMVRTWYPQTAIRAPAAHRWIRPRPATPPSSQSSQRPIHTSWNRRLNPVIRSTRVLSMRRACCSRSFSVNRWIVARPVSPAAIRPVPDTISLAPPASVPINLHGHVSQETQHQDPDEPGVEAPDVKDTRCALLGLLDVHPAFGELGARAGVTGAARGREIRLGDTGAGIAGGSHVVESVTAGAIGRLPVSEFRGDSVEAVGIRLLPLGRQAVRLDDALGRVAGPAGPRDVPWRHLRRRIRGRGDGVLAVAAGAGGGILDPLGQGHGMDAVVVLGQDPRVAPAAGLGHVQAVDGRAGVVRRLDIVRPVTARAGGGHREPLLGHGLPVHAFPVGADEQDVRHPRMASGDPGVRVAFHADLRLAEGLDSGRRVPHADDVVPAVTALAGWRFPDGSRYRPPGRGAIGQGRPGPHTWSGPALPAGPGSRPDPRGTAGT